MSVQKKLDVLLEEIEKNVNFFEKRREKNKRKAFNLKIASIITTALITVLLGLKTIQSDLLLDITLALSVLVTIFNGIDSFYNHKELWAKDVITLARLRELKRDLKFFSAGETSDSLSLELLTNYQERLQSIFDDDVSTWSTIREEVNSTDITSGS